MELDLTGLTRDERRYVEAFQCAELIHRTPQKIAKTLGISVTAACHIAISPRARSLQQQILRIEQLEHMILANQYSEHMLIAKAAATAMSDGIEPKDQVDMIAKVIKMKRTADIAPLAADDQTTVIQVMGETPIAGTYVDAMASQFARKMIDSDSKEDTETEENEEEPESQG